MNPISSFVAFGADHAGFALKNRLAAALPAAGLGLDARDLGAYAPASVDYPDYAHRVCRAVLSGEARFGVLICGTGIGMSIAANRFAGIRCALVHDATGARLARAHNNANVIAFGARLIGEEVALDALQIFLTSAYEAGRHDRRLAKLDAANAATGDNANLRIGAL